MIDIKQIQTALQELGFYEGEIDGIFGPKTKRALMAFQDQHYVTGEFDAKTAVALSNAILMKNQEQDARIISRPFPVPAGKKQIEDLFGKIEYRNLEGGAIDITNSFVRDNIVVYTFPVVGKQVVHRMIVTQLEKVLMEICANTEARESIHQFGSFCPRHKMHDKARDLSAHSWGIAVDVNWSENPPGVRGVLHQDIVRAFEDHGFQWGGRWLGRSIDPMHFQYCTNY